MEVAGKMVIKALGIHNEDFVHIFGSNITIKGYFPFYPAIGLAESISNLNRAPELLNAELLINNESPPC